MPHLVQLLRHIGVVVLMGGVQQEQGAYLAGEPLRVMARVQAAERMAGQQVGCGHAGGPQKLAQLAAAMTALLAEFNTYLDRDHADPTGDSVGYRQIPLWLSQAELAELIGEMRNVIVSKLDNKPTPDRSLHLLSPILFPIEEPPQPHAQVIDGSG